MDFRFGDILQRAVLGTDSELRSPIYPYWKQRLTKGEIKLEVLYNCSCFMRFDEKMRVDTNYCQGSTEIADYRIPGSVM